MHYVPNTCEMKEELNIIRDQCFEDWRFEDWPFVDRLLVDRLLEVSFVLLQTCHNHYPESKYTGFL